METILKLLKYNVFLICLVGCIGKNQNSISATNKIGIIKVDNLQSIQIQEDTLRPKDLSAISKFADTTTINKFIEEIKNFEKDDSINQNRIIDIVFTGSSSIRKWASLQNDMKGLKVINRGFGGSTIPEVIYYSDILVFKHKPKQIVFYAGENDISSSKSDSMKVFSSFVYFQKLVKQKLPETKLFFISIKLSPVRMEYWGAVKSTNKMIENYCNSTKNCTYIDVNKAMLDNKMQVRKDLYLEDNLHLNSAGYQIWTKIILKSLKKQNK